MEAKRPSAGHSTNTARRSRPFADRRAARGPDAGAPGPRRTREAHEDVLAAPRPDAFEHGQDAMPGARVVRVGDDAQVREHVLHVRGLDEAKPAALHERDVAPAELDLEIE